MADAVPQLAELDPLVERVAKELHKRSLQRDGLTDILKTWDEQWEIAKRLYAQKPNLYLRPVYAIEDARLAVALVRQSDAGR